MPSIKLQTLLVNIQCFLRCGVAKKLAYLLPHGTVGGPQFNSRLGVTYPPPPKKNKQTNFSTRLFFLYFIKNNPLVSTLKLPSSTEYISIKAFRLVQDTGV